MEPNKQQKQMMEMQRQHGIWEPLFYYDRVNPETGIFADILVNDTQLGSLLKVVDKPTITEDKPWENNPLNFYLQPITVCLLVNEEGVLTRGISICSPCDIFVKTVGRAQALGRAIQSLVQWKSFPLRKNLCGKIGYLEAAYVIKKYENFSSLYPELTDFEGELYQSVAKHHKESVPGQSK